MMFQVFACRGDIHPLVLCDAEAIDRVDWGNGSGHEDVEGTCSEDDPKPPRKSEVLSDSPVTAFYLVPTRSDRGYKLSCDTCHVLTVLCVSTWNSSLRTGLQIVSSPFSCWTRQPRRQSNSKRWPRHAAKMTKHVKWVSVWQRTMSCGCLWLSITCQAWLVHHFKLQVLEVRAAFLQQEGLQEDTCLSVEQHSAVMKQVRSLFNKDETVNVIYLQFVEEFGKDMAQRKRRSLFRNEMRRCFGHAVIADVLAIKGYWSQNLQDRLVEERGRQQTAGGPELHNSCPSIHRSAAGRKKAHGAAKHRKRERYFANWAVRQTMQENAQKF